MKTLTCLISTILLLFLAITAAMSQTLQLAITQDFNKRLITDEQKLLYQALSVVHPELLPEKYRELAIRADKCGTFPLFEVRKNWDTLSPANQALLSSYFDRPVLPDSIISASGLFKIHYTLTGNNATTEQFAQEAAAAFDYAYQVEVVELGYPAPPSDYNIDGSQYDIYIMEIIYYGYTQPEMEVPSTPQNDWTTFIVVDNDYSEANFFTQGIEALRVTSAHEFFHAIHFGIREPIWPPLRNADVFYYEISSTWMEDVVWDEINDYLQDFYLLSFFNYPHMPFNTSNGCREYGQAVWNHFIEKKYGRQIIRNSWDYMRNEGALDAIRLALADDNLNFGEVLAEFSVWNYFTAHRADTIRYYEEGNYYPEVKIASVEEFDRQIELDSTAQSLSSSYYCFIPETADYYASYLQGEQDQEWRVASIVNHAHGTKDVAIAMPSTKVSLGFVGSSDSIVIIPSHVEIPETTTPSYPQVTYQFSIHIEPDTSMNELVAENRIVSINPNPFIIGEKTTTKIIFEVSGEQDVSVIITETTGRVIRGQELGRYTEGTEHSWSWDGRNSDNEYVASGIYIVFMSFGKEYKSEKIAVIH